MTDKQLKKLLYEHPYLIDSAFVRSRSEAERLAKESTITIEEFIERGKRRPNLPPEAWDVFTEALARMRARELQEASKLNVLAYITRTPRFIRRAVAVFIILVSLTVFFTATKPGVALAHAAYEIIVRLFDGKLTAQQSKLPDELPPIDFENIPDQFESFEEAARVIGRPVAAIGHVDAVLVRINVDVLDGIMVILKSEYQINENTLYLSHVFYSSVRSWGSGVSSGDNIIEAILQDGNIMYLGYMDEGTTFGEAYSDSYNLSISSEDIDVNELLSIIAELRFIG